MEQAIGPYASGTTTHLELTAQLVVLPMVAVLTMAVILWGRVSGSLSKLGSLAVIELEHCPDVLTWCQSDLVVARYQTAVAESGRMLIEAEVTAMKLWMLNQRQRECEARQIKACEALRLPVNLAPQDPG